MRDAQTTSWRRFSDRACNDADYVGNGCTGSSNETETRQLEVWEDEGGQPPAVSVSVPITQGGGDVGLTLNRSSAAAAAGPSGPRQPPCRILLHCCRVALGSRRRAQEQSREGGAGL
jgi:hypothetical protein